MSIKNSHEPALPEVSRGRPLPPIDPMLVEVSMLLCGARLQSEDDGDAGRTYGCNFDAGHEGDHIDLMRNPGDPLAEIAPVQAQLAHVVELSPDLAVCDQVGEVSEAHSVEPSRLIHGDVLEGDVVVVVSAEVELSATWPTPGSARLGAGHSGTRRSRAHG